MNSDDHGICVVGQGYVGLTLTAAMARSGYDVLGIEIDEEKLEGLQNGTPYFEERGLEETIQTHQSLGKLRFRKSIETADISDRSVYIIAVGSPLDGDGSDTSSLESAVDSIAGVVEAGDTVVIRSTISVGTARDLFDRLIEKSSINQREKIYYLQAPERTVQGDALAEIHNLPQVVGGYDDRSTTRGAELFSRTADVIIEVESLEAAEMLKLFDNTYRDINIAIGNAFGQIARQHGIDGQRLIKLANSGYARNNIKQPGAGVGGGCLPKDPYLLIESMRAGDGEGISKTISSLITNSRSINESMPSITVKQAREALNQTGREGSINALVLGVAFKGHPSTNDIRNTPAKPIIEGLREYGDVDAYDPDVEDWKIDDLGARPVHPKTKISTLFEEETYDMVVLANNNPTFEDLNLYDVRSQMADSPIIVDGWNILPTETVTELGFHYEVVGGVSYDPDEDEN
jgi:nucleotide sugar dehydrogenase